MAKNKNKIEENPPSILPLGDRVLILPDKVEEKMVSGIIIPGAQEQITGTVIGIGPGKLLDNGDYAPIELTYGDHVMLGKYGNDLISVDGQEFYIVSRETILAIIN